MRFEYKIYEEVYNDILSGNKNIEFRLLNDKSKKIKPNDEILFKVLNNEEKTILVQVINKTIYNNLDELWNNKDILGNTLNYTKEKFISTFNNIFGEEKVNNSKIVGIKFKKISNSTDSSCLF